MANSYGVRVMRGGSAVNGAVVTIGTHLAGTTGSNGIVSGSLEKGGRAIVVPVVVTGSGFAWGTSGIRIPADSNVDVEV
jgi:hypothetical protein